MPIYVWVCPDCNDTVEKLVSNWDDAVNTLVICPSCGMAMTKVQHPRTAPPQFQGAGWARDGYSKAEKP